LRQIEAGLIPDLTGQREAGQIGEALVFTNFFQLFTAASRPLWFIISIIYRFKENDTNTNIYLGIFFV